MSWAQVNYFSLGNYFDCRLHLKVRHVPHRQSVKFYIFKSSPINALPLDIVIYILHLQRKEIFKGIMTWLFVIKMKRRKAYLGNLQIHGLNRIHC